MKSQLVQKAIEALQDQRRSMIESCAEGVTAKPTPGWFHANQQDIDVLTKLRDRLMASESSSAGVRK